MISWEEVSLHIKILKLKLRNTKLKLQNAKLKLQIAFYSRVLGKEYIANLDRRREWEAKVNDKSDAN